MGRPKALLPWPGGRSPAPPGNAAGITDGAAGAAAAEPASEPVVRVLAKTLAAAGLSPVFVVLGHARREIAAALAGLPFPIEPVQNPAWRSGVLSSVKAGIRAVSRRPEAQWVLLTLVDQPFLTPALVRRLVEAAESPGSPGEAPGKPPPAAIAPADRERRREARFGHPVLLSRRLFPEILAERPRAPEDEDRGARRVLARHHAAIRLVPADPRELATMETRADYDRLRRHSTDRPRSPHR